MPPMTTVPESYEYSDVTVGLYCPREVHDSQMREITELLATKFEDVAWHLASRENIVDEDELEGLSGLKEEVEIRLRYSA